NRDSQYTDVVENPLDSDEQQEPTKTISANSPDGYTTNTETVEGEDGAADTVTYNNSVGVGSTIEYVISCYNNNNYKTTVTITDDLDDGVTFVSASDGGTVSGQSGDESTFYYGGTVTWTLEVEPLTEVTVYLEVLVNENARITEDGEDTATVENQATVTVGEVSNDTNIVVNPVDPDEPGDPDKVVSAASKAGIDGANVSEGDQITYTISFYNHNNSSADVTIVDELDDGVDFVTASFDGTTLTYDEENDVSTVTSSDGDVTITYDKDSHTVTWTIKNVSAFTGGEVDLTVEVNSSAVIQVANDAEVTVGDNKQTTDVVTNPVDDDPEDPVKTETDHRIVDTDEDGTITYDDVAVDEEITYTISYYNYYGTPATITIEDKLDDGVEYVDSSDDGVYDSDTHTVTWTLENVEAYEHGTVTLIVKVTETAKETVSDETEATVENQATVTVGDDGGNTTNLVINPLEDDDPQDPEKTESGYGEGTEVEEEDGNVIYYDEVSVGDEITYTISYYNHYNTATTVTITDELDAGVDFVSASGVDEASEEYDPNTTEADYVSYTYDETTHTVTWTIKNATALTEGSVVLIVQVNEDAKDTDDNEDTATVENQATVTVGEVTNDTDIVVNPINPDDPEDPEKVVSAESEAGVDGVNVAVGDQITYTISYYNHTNSSSVITIEDELDAGVDFVSAGCNGITLVYDKDSGVYSTEDSNVTISYDEEAHTVTWTIENVSAFTGGTVDLTVEVNSEAVTQLEVVNDADVTVGDNTYTTNLVTNPVDDEPEEPVKTVNVGDGTEVSVGDRLVYAISYYNNLGTAADITIVDVLDEGVTYVSSSDGGVYDADTHTVTWTLSNVKAYKHGEVRLTVTVNENARTAGYGETASVVNDADVTVGNQETQTTNIVENPLEPDEPTEPEKEVSERSEAGVDGANVSQGDQITYTISYYNNTNSAALVTIEDALDEGVDFVSATCGDVTLVYDKDSGVTGTDVGDVTISYDEETHTVTWSIRNVSAFTEGTVDLTVEVNSEAVPQVENDADVTIGNNDTQTTDKVTNPVDDEPEDPVKTEISITDAETGETDSDLNATVDGETLTDDTAITEETTITYDEVAVGDEITYTISYYNHYGTPSTITIEDELDPGVEFVSAGGTYTRVNEGIWRVTESEADAEVTVSESGTKVTWTLTNVKAYDRGTVTLTVRVTETAMETASDETEATVENQATVTVGDVENDTNYVVNPLEDDEHEESKEVEVYDNADDGSVDFADDGDTVYTGQTVTYKINYYNNTGSTA
ncbi:MAG: DUF11 domain-containing protein, partial [Clostridiales bacterium]|nr:DUF11 domain-containing protein [Clostridiales bacterium]